MAPEQFELLLENRDQIGHRVGLLGQLHHEIAHVHHIGSEIAASHDLSDGVDRISDSGGNISNVLSHDALLEGIAATLHKTGWPKQRCGPPTSIQLHCRAWPLPTRGEGRSSRSCYTRSWRPSGLTRQTIITRRRRTWGQVRGRQTGGESIFVKAIPTMAPMRG